MSKTGIKGVIWHTSPACARILERLECRGPGRPDEIGAEIHSSLKHTEALLRLLKAAERVHVSRWRRNLAGAATPVYTLGPGMDVAKPPRETHAQHCARRRKALIAKYGKEIANKVLNPKIYGYPTIMINGERVTSSSGRSYLGGGA